MFEQVFPLFEGSQTVCWYELGVGRRLYQQRRVLLGNGRQTFGDPCILRAGYHTPCHYRLLSIAQNLGVQLSTPKIYGWLGVGDELEA